MNAARTLRAGAILGLVGVGAGAFGAHALKDHVDAAGLAIWETAVRYQVWHALALLACAALHNCGWNVRWAARAFTAGTIVFSGTLYALVGSGARWLGAITPLGGVLLLVGWVLLALAARTKRTDPDEAVHSR